MGDKTGEATSIFVAAEAVAGNEDLLLQILLRVPVRPLIQLKLVSKPWKALISGEELGRNHTRIGSLTGTKPHSPSGLYFYGRRQLHSVSLTADNHGISPPSLSDLVEAARVSNFRFDVLQSCNGLLLCSMTSRVRGRDFDSYYMVLNPTLMETKVVTFPKRNSADVDKVRCSSLYFDPVESPHFKVVCFKVSEPGGRHHEYRCFLNVEPYEILIYSSESDSWRSCGNFVPPEGIGSDKGVSCNGVIYWIGYYDLLHFRIDTESMTTSELPQISPSQYYGIRKRVFFGECGGHLHLILQSGYHSGARFKFFELNKETLEWLENPFYSYTPTISGFLQEQFRRYVRRPSVLFIIRRDKEKESAMVWSIPGQVMSYNYFNNTTQVLGEFPCENPRESNPRCSTTYHYIETLSPLKQCALFLD